jgi:hypothetical protein
MAESSSKYVLRVFNKDDYEEYCKWWGEDKPPPISSLPPLGLVCGDMLAVGFLGNTDADFAIIAFWMNNINNTKKDNYMSLEKIMKGLCDLARLIGKNNVFFYTTKRSMIRMLEKLGFVNHDGHLILEL